MMASDFTRLLESERASFTVCSRLDSALRSSSSVARQAMHRFCHFTPLLRALQTRRRVVQLSGNGKGNCQARLISDGHCHAPLSFESASSPEESCSQHVKRDGTTCSPPWPNLRTLSSGPLACRFGEKMACRVSRRRAADTSALHLSGNARNTRRNFPLTNRCLQHSVTSINSPLSYMHRKTRCEHLAFHYALQGWHLKPLRSIITSSLQDTCYHGASWSAPAVAE
jgi:hypothetical protein